MSRFRAAFIGSLISALAATTSFAADVALARRMTVAVCDLEGVPSDRMLLARGVAAEAYRDIGIELNWTNSQCRPDDRTLTITITSRSMADLDVTDYTLGFAVSGTRTATVLYDRVHAFARRYHIKGAVMLGYVMAHELGHLLLPPKSHSPEGLMSATLNLEQASARRLRFTPDQGALIVSRLDGLPSRVAMATH